MFDIRTIAIDCPAAFLIEIRKPIRHPRAKQVIAVRKYQNIKPPKKIIT
tara:strand:- start:3267 stop:3413 length:147 start_codon:yes stop_codon:yes gene_type:complete